jgi:hypothetical protein
MSVLKRLLGLLLVGSAAFAFTACGDDSDSSSSSCDTATLEDDVTTALTTFFEAEDVDEKVSVVDQGDVVAQYVEAANDAAQESGQSIPVTVQAGSVEVSNESDTEADITFGIAAQDAPDEQLVESAGTAVCVDGEWFISATTVCDTTSLGSPDIGQECLDAIG